MFVECLGESLTMADIITLTDGRLELQENNSNVDKKQSFLHKTCDDCVKFENSNHIVVDD